MEQLMYGVEAASKILGLGRVKTYELLMSGRLASVTIGRRRLILAEDLRAFAERLKAEQATVA